MITLMFIYERNGTFFDNHATYLGTIQKKINVMKEAFVPNIFIVGKSLNGVVKIYKLTSISLSGLV